MERISRKLAENIGGSLGYDKEKIAVLSYGLLAILQIVIIFSAFSVVCAMMKCWTEAIIIFTSVGILRKSTGGAHSETFLGCVIFSILLVVMMSFFARYAMYPFTLGQTSAIRGIFIVIFAFIYLIMFIRAYKLVPVDSVKRPIRNPEKIARLRRNSFITYAVYCTLTLVLTLLSDYNERFLSMGFSLCLASLWQTFTLTKTGRRFIYYLDNKFGVAREVS